MTTPTVIETSEHAILYDLLLTKQERKFLAQIRSGSRQMFEVGDIALRARERAQANGFPDFSALVIVAEEAGIQPKRLAKLAHVAERFPEKIREKYSVFPFAVFEEAIVFLPGEDVQMLEYAKSHMSDTQRWPGAEKIAGSFRKEILGLETGHPVTAQGSPSKSNGAGRGGAQGVQVVTRAHQYQIDPVRVDPKEWISAADLKKLIGKWRGRGVTVQGCIKDLEKLIS